MRDHQLDNRLNLLALLTALGFVLAGVVHGAAQDRADREAARLAQRAVPEVQLPRVLVQASRSHIAAAEAHQVAALCPDGSLATMESTLPSAKMN